MPEAQPYKIRKSLARGDDLGEDLSGSARLVGHADYADDTVSTFAASHLSPSYPDRAAWGTAPKLRAWQQEAFDLYSSREPRDFLAVATPGAGKTTFALRIVSELLARGIIRP